MAALKPLPVIYLLLLGARIVAPESDAVNTTVSLKIDEAIGNHGMLSLELDKPLGLVVQSSYSGSSDVGSGVIVASLLEGKRGSAHSLPAEVQEQIVGSRVVAINHENTTRFSLFQVTELVRKVDSPVLVEFDLGHDDGNDEQEETKVEIAGYAPHVQDHVAPGQVSPLRWLDSNEPIDSLASRVGLPETLMPSIHSFAEQVRLKDMLKTMLFSNPCGGRQGRFHRSNFTNDKELLWYAQRPYLSSSWESDLHYFSPADENTYEAVLDMLFNGGFGTIIEAIGTHFNLDSLAVQGIGFLGVTHCEEGSIHHDFRKLGGKAFNLLLPIHSVEGTDPELVVAGWKSTSLNRTTNEYTGDDEEDEMEFIGTKVKYTPDSSIGMLMGDSTWHGTRACDNRPMKDARIMMNIFLVDVTEQNVEPIASDMIDIFPVPGMTGWLWAQRGRHWRNDMCIDRDPGRLPFQPRDQYVDCPFRADRGDCESQPTTTRLQCPISCDVYLNDGER